MALRDSLIESALQTARTRMNAGVSKVASAPDVSVDEGLRKEASEVANALEYASLALADDGSAAGTARTEMIRDFFKKSAEAGTPVPHGPTKASGEQGQVPNGSKRKILPLGQPGGAGPAVSEAPEGQMNREVMAQQPPAVKETPTDKKAGGTTLYDMIRSSQEAGKVAAAGGPVELDPQQKAPGIPSKNENVNRESLLSSNEGIVRATKREAKKPTRGRLAELFRSATDTTGDASAKAVWPGAAAKGDIKIASSLRSIQKQVTR